MAREEKKRFPGTYGQLLFASSCSFGEQHSSLLIDYLLIIHSLLLIEKVYSLQFQLVLTYERWIEKMNAMGGQLMKDLNVELFDIEKCL